MSNVTKRSGLQPAAMAAPSPARKDIAASSPSQQAQHRRGQEQQHDRHTADATQAVAQATVPPCPEWCGEKPGHDYDSLDPTTGTVERHHSWDAPDADEHNHRARASINQCETALDGVVTLHAPYILVSADGEMTAEQARGYAKELQAAASKLDEINGADLTAGLLSVFQSVSDGLSSAVDLLAQEKARRAQTGRQK